MSDEGYMRFVPQAALDELQQEWERIVKKYELGIDVGLVVLDKREFEIAAMVAYLGAKEIRRT